MIRAPKNSPIIRKESISIEFNLPIIHGQANLQFALQFNSTLWTRLEFWKL